MTSNSAPTTPLSVASAIRLGHWLWKRPILMFIIIGMVVASVYWYVNSGSNKPVNSVHSKAESELNETSVVVSTVRQGSLKIYLFGLGVVTPLNTVEVSSRVDGQLMNIAFEEGQMVKAGDLLAQIDPLPFKVQLELATGQLVRDQALLDKALVDLARYRKLLKQDSTTLQLVETKESLLRQYQTAVLADEGSVTSAKLQLKYARIIAPISGRVGFRQVDAGNIVRASDAKGIVRITQLDPISVIFPIPEDALPSVMKLLATGEHIPVDVYDRSMKEIIGKGRLLAVDNQIDVTTGTIKLKAELPNPSGSLFANQFANVRMPVETRSNATLVPTVAIQRGTAGTFVYVVKKDQTVVVTPVKTGPSQGEITAIEDGVSAGAMVVVEGADRLRQGAKVRLVVRDTPISDTAEKELKHNNKNNNPQSATQNPRTDDKS